MFVDLRYAQALAEERYTRRNRPPTIEITDTHN